MCFFFFFSLCGSHRVLHSFPTRRSSDLFEVAKGFGSDYAVVEQKGRWCFIDKKGTSAFLLDRKSTRLNSSHRCISYAVFCLKKKKKKTKGHRYHNIVLIDHTYGS